MSALWTSDEVAKALSPIAMSGAFEATGVTFDSRAVGKGDIFFALAGETTDGHQYVTEALSRRAAAAVVSRDVPGASGNLIRVPDTMKALVDLGRAGRVRSGARIASVTGSVGKTSTKDALRAILSAQAPTVASAASYNNHVGVPISLARLSREARYGVFEIGMNHPGEIRPLVKLVRPHIAVVTLIAAAHLGHFKSLDEIARAKAEIFEGVEPGGHALINRDDPRFKLLDKAARAAGVAHVWGFGENNRAQFRLMKYKPQPDSSAIAARIDGQDICAKVGAPGRHMAQNALAVLGAAHLAGADLAKVALALSGIEAERGRGRRHTLVASAGTFTLIDESYNANPASMKAAIELLDATPVGPGGRRIAVLGDMLELGSHSARLHGALAEIIAQTNTDMVFLAGPEMKTLAEALPVDFHAEYRPGVEELQALVLKTVRAGDAVMVKSSNGIGFSRIVDALAKAFPAARNAA